MVAIQLLRAVGFHLLLHPLLLLGDLFGSAMLAVHAARIITGAAAAHIFEAFREVKARLGRIHILLGAVVVGPHFFIQDRFAFERRYVSPGE